MSQTESKKLLSLITTGRDDDYGGNFKYRLTTCLNYLARNLNKIHKLDAVEVVITDWNSQTPLSKALDLSPEAVALCRFIRVSPELAVQHQPADAHFNIPCAMNVALRRSSGRFKMIAGADVLFPVRSLEILMEMLEGKVTIPHHLEACLFLLPRKSISCDVVFRRPTLDEWDDYIRRYGGMLIESFKAYPGAGVAYGAFLMASPLWEACRGFDEKYCYWGGSDEEMVMRMGQKYPYMDLANLGIELFDMVNVKAFQDEPVTPRVHRNPQQIHTAFEANTEAWGIAGKVLEMEEAAPQVHCSIVEDSQMRWEKIGNLSAKSPEKIVSEMTGVPLFSFVKNSIHRSRGISDAEWAACCLTAWVCSVSFPRKYFEYGIACGQTSYVAAGICRGIEIYGADFWQPTQKNRGLCLPSDLSHLLYERGFQGYLRMISGDPNTALERLNSSLTEKLCFDLAVFRAGVLNQEAPDRISEILSKISKGGALIFYGESKSQYQKIIRAVQDRCPGEILWNFEEMNLGVLLRVQLHADQAPILLKEHQDRLLRAWKTAKPARSSEWWRWSKSTLKDFYRHLVK